MEECGKEAEDAKRAGSGLPPSGVISTMQDHTCMGLCFMSFFSVVSARIEEDCAMISYTDRDRNPIHLPRTRSSLACEGTDWQDLQDLSSLHTMNGKK